MLAQGLRPSADSCLGSFFSCLDKTSWCGQNQDKVRLIHILQRDSHDRAKGNSSFEIPSEVNQPSMCEGNRALPEQPPHLTSQVNPVGSDVPKDADALTVPQQEETPAHPAWLT